MILSAGHDEDANFFFPRRFRLSLFADPPLSPVKKKRKKQTDQLSQVHTFDEYEAHKCGQRMTHQRKHLSSPLRQWPLT